MRIVYDSFHGRYSDNPRALHERLEGRSGLEHIWLADPDHAAGYPSAVSTVDIFSPAAVEALESADLVVANTHVELEWQKAPGTTYLQTWHGTPLKRVHRDVLWAPEGRLDRLDRDVAKWDLLLSPNRVSTPRLRRAFRYQGEVLESGYPRNDVLSRDEGGALRGVVRKSLGLDDGDRVVLYTPTWRDDECFAEGAPDVPLGMDVERFVAELGEDHVLLVRSHNMVTGRSRVPTTPRVRDVSLHPDVRDLYLAADVLVTDYSSTMFDFAITGRPVLFLAYDLERFQDSIRGFYFDLVPVAPGPVVRSTEELVLELRSLDTYAERYGDRYAAFQAEFTALEDGRATDRVLSRLGLA